MKNDVVSDGRSAPERLRAACVVALSAVAATLLGCSADSGENAGAAGSTEPRFVTSSVVFSSEGENTYVSSLATLESQAVDLGRARELPGWSSIWGHAGKLFVGDGESPLMTRYGVDDGGTFTNEGEVSFLEHGARSADTLFVGADKAYVFAQDAVVWDPEALQIVGDFPLPEVPAREGGLEYSGLRTGRGTVVRGDRAYVATHWVNWDEYDVAEDSAIVVIDTRNDELIQTLPVPCPYLDVASMDDDGTIYFSNWVYSLGPTLSGGKAKACAVRILPGEDRLDGDWSLTFADVTEGREAAALRALGDGTALISVYHDEQADLTADHAALADSPNWRFWILDLQTFDARPLQGIGFHAGGFNTARIDGRNFLLVPSGDYETTTTYELLSDGGAEPRWESKGWSTQLLRLR